MTNSTKISIITATWNCCKTLPDCLTSVKQQDYSNIEHIIIDGASTDGTISIINNNINQFSAFVSERDNGIYDALNKGLELAKGDVVGFLHSDDLFASNHVLSIISKVFEDPSICAVYGDLNYVDTNDITKIVRRWRSNSFRLHDIDWGWMPAHPTLYVRREWYLKIGGFDTNYRIASDYLTILKFFKNSDFKTVYLPEVLVTMRLGGASNKSLLALIKKLKEDWGVLKQCGFSPLGALQAIIGKNLRKIIQFL